MAGFRLLDDASGFLAPMLIAALWQSVLLTVSTAVLIRLFPRMSGRHQFNVWGKVLILCLLLPSMEARRWFHDSHPAIRSDLSTAPITNSTLLVVDHRWAVACIVLWSAASICALTRLIFALWTVGNLLRTATPLGGQPQSVFLHRCENTNRNKVRILISDEVDTPVATGFHRPSIVLPRHLLAKLTAEEWDHILQHEAAHLSRRDDWLALGARLAVCIFPFNLALYYIESRLAKAREEACDDIVLESAPLASRYAECLAHVAETMATRKATRLATGLVSTKAHLLERIEYILDFRREDRRFSRKTACASTLLVLGLSMKLLGSPILVSFAPGSVAAPSAEIVSPQLLGAPTGAHGSRVRPMIAPKFPTSNPMIPGITERSYQPVRLS